MLKQLARSLKPFTRREPGASGRATRFSVYTVTLSEKTLDVVSLVPHEIAFKWGLADEAIVGFCTQPPGDVITAANFRPNRAFLILLHTIVATHSPGLPEAQMEARRIHSGSLSVIDWRTPTPAGEVPSHDIIGAFEVANAVIVSGSYRPNPNHQLFSSAGFFQLSRSLEDKLMERVIAATKQSSASNLRMK